MWPVEGWDATKKGMAMLVIVQGLGSGSSLPLAAEAIIGRQTGVDLKLEGANISRRHARFFLIEGRYFVEDLGSSNGTFVNDAKIKGRMGLANGDQIRIGPYVLRFDASSDPAKDSVIKAETLADLSNVDIFRKGAEEKLQTVLQIAHELAKALEVDDLLSQILERLFGLFQQADRALFIAIENGKPQVRASQSRGREPKVGVMFSHTVIQRVLQNRTGIVAEEVPPDMGQSICSLGLRSFMCAPLKTEANKIIGVIQLDRFSAGQSFNTEDLYLLTAVSIQLSAVLENARLHQELLQKERMERELALAREIQAGYLPSKVPDFGGALELHSMLHPALEVSGDFYDYFMLDANRMAFAIADVCGKGMPAALFMASVRTLLRYLAPVEPSPGMLLKKLNDAIAVENPKSYFVTILYGICDVQKAEMTIARAGHPPPLLRRAKGDVQSIGGSHGWLLGIMEDVLPLEETRVVLEPGDCLFAYTDGISEAGSSGDKGLFGTERLTEALAKMNPEQTLDKAFTALRNNVAQFCESPHCEDDLTLLAMRRPLGAH
jgi:sigma-B regulation protein RsbU (phosphoserine phosphatase)